MHEVECLTVPATGRRWRSALDRVDAGEADPACLVCGGILKSATVSFGQELDPAGARGRRARPPRTATCSSPSAPRCRCSRSPGWPRSRPTHGARMVIVNAEPTPYDDLADVVVREPIGTALPRLLAPA